MSRQAWASSMSILLTLAGLSGAWWWLNQDVTLPAITITAASDIPDEQGLPVYAQFNMTQTLSVADPIKVTELTVPVYFPQETKEPLVVELWRYDALISRWRYQPEKFGSVVPVVLPLTPPQLLDGDISIRFEAKSITSDQQEIAPRLFVESADIYYPAGNYYISGNQKSGDIALTIHSQITNLDLVLRELDEQPLSVAAIGSRWLAVAMVIVMVPYPIVRLWGDAHLAG